jgi:hypothetical protein
VTRCGGILCGACGSRLPGYTAPCLTCEQARLPVGTRVWADRRRGTISDPPERVRDGRVRVLVRFAEGRSPDGCAYDSYEQYNDVEKIRVIEETTMGTMKLVQVALVAESTETRYKVLLECDPSDMRKLVMFGTGGAELPPAPDTPEKPKKAAAKKTEAAAPANGAPAPDANPDWGVDAEKPVEKPVTAAAPAAKAANGTAPAADVPPELAGAKVLSEIVRYFIAQGITSKDEVLDLCTSWKAKAGDRIPVLARIENLQERIDRGGAALGLT